MVEYERAVLAALHETEDALAQWLAAERERTAQGLAQADREAIIALAVHRQRQGLASVQEVIATRLAVLVRRGDLQHSEARVTGAKIAVLKALGAGIRHNTAAPVAVSMLKRDAQVSLIRISLEAGQRSCIPTAIATAYHRR